MAALLAFALGAFVLAAWWMRAWRLAAFEAGRIPMAPITATLFVLLGLSLAARARWPDLRAARAASVLASAFALVTSALVALQSRRVLALPWDTWFLDAPTLVGAVPIGRMSPLTSVAFVLAALAQLAQAAPLAGRHALRVAAALLGGAGFSIGALVMVSYFSGAPLLYGGQTIPMALPTAVGFLALCAALLLVGDAHAILREWRNRRATPEVPEADAFGRRLVVAICVVSCVIFLSGFFSLRDEHASARAGIYRQLTTIVDLKATQIGEWQRERLADARFFQKDPALVADILALGARPADPALRARCLGWLTLFTGHEGYESARIFDAKGTLLLALPAVPDPAAQAPPEGLAAALTKADVGFTDLHDSARSNRHMDQLVPIGTRHVLVLGLNLRPTLLPMLQTWPAADTTGEILLLRREGDEVVYLSASRHADPDGTLRKPVHSRPVDDLPSGHEALAPQAGLDYRGVPALTAFRRVPGSPWILAAKVDQAEVDGTLEGGAWRTIAPFGVALLVVGLVGAFAWGDRRGALLRGALSAERESKLMIERFIAEQKLTQDALRKSEAQHRAITQSAYDAIITSDSAGVIVGWNRGASLIFEYEESEAMGQPITLLIPQRHQEGHCAGISRMRSGEELRLLGKTLELHGRRKDGSEFPLELTLSTWEGEGSVFGTAIIGDITERKRAEQVQLDSLREKEALLKETHHRVKNNLALIASLMRLEAGRSHEPETKAKLQEMQARIRSVVLLNETLYRTGSYASVQLANYLKQIATHAFQAQNADPDAIRMVLDLEPVEVDTAQAIPCGLIVNELLTNSLKHAFNFGTRGEVRVLLRAEADGQVRLVVSDTGSGLPEDFASRRDASLGLQLVSDLARQLLGHLDLVPPSTFVITFSRGHRFETNGIPRGAATNA